MAVKFTESSLRARAEENRKEANAIRAKSAPLREERDKLADEIRPTENLIREKNQEIKKVEEPLYELDMEYSRIAKALPGNRSVPPVEAGTFNGEAKPKVPKPKR